MDVSDSYVVWLDYLTDRVVARVVSGARDMLLRRTLSLVHARIHLGSSSGLVADMASSPPRYVSLV